MLRSFACTTKRMHRGIAVEDFGGPYALCAVARPAERVSTAGLFGGRFDLSKGCAGYPLGLQGGNVRSSECSEATKEDKPPKDEEIVLNSTCFNEGYVELGGVCAI